MINELSFGNEVPLAGLGERHFECLFHILHYGGIGNLDAKAILQPLALVMAVICCFENAACVLDKEYLYLVISFYNYVTKEKGILRSFYGISKSFTFSILRNPRPTRASISSRRPSALVLLRKFMKS